MKYFLAKFKGSLITALVFVVLLGFIFIRNTENNSTEVISESNAFITDGEVVSVEIYYPKSWVLLEREGDDWFLVKEEEKLGADKKLVNNLIEEIQNTEIIGTVPTDEVDLDQFGLLSAKAEIVLSTEEEDHNFIVGDKIPVGLGTYVYDPEAKIVFVVEKDYLDEYIDMSSIDFRDRGLFDIDSSGVNRISIWSGDFSVDMFKEEDEWFVDGQEEILVDNKKIDEILWVFSRAKVLDFEDQAPENLKRYGLDEPTTEIRFYEDDQIQGVIFGKRKNADSYYIQSDSDDAVYSIHKSLFKIVPKNIDQISFR